MVRTAVATVESVFLIPHFAKIDVTPAKNADPAAYKSHIQIPSLLVLLCQLMSTTQMYDTDPSFHTPTLCLDMDNFPHVWLLAGDNFSRWFL